MKSKSISSSEQRCCIVSSSAYCKCRLRKVTQVNFDKAHILKTKLQWEIDNKFQSECILPQKHDLAITFVC